MQDLPQQRGQSISGANGSVCPMISHENRILSDVMMGFESPILPIMIVAAAPAAD